MGTTSGPIKALLAAGPGGVAIIVAHDSPWLATDIDGIANSAADIGLDEPPEPGIWLWEGSGKLVGYSGPDGNDPPEPEYTGTLRRVELGELEALLALEPPETCEICGKLATTYYPPDSEDGAPSCGRAECELRMQAAADFQGEYGDRG